MSTRRNDQPKWYTTNSVRRKVMSDTGRVGRAQQKNVFWPKLGTHPTDVRLDRWLLFPAACQTRFRVR